MPKSKQIASARRTAIESLGNSSTIAPSSATGAGTTAPPGTVFAAQAATKIADAAVAAAPQPSGTSGSGSSSQIGTAGGSLMTYAMNGPYSLGKTLIGGGMPPSSSMANLLLGSTINIGLSGAAINAVSGMSLTSPQGFLLSGAVQVMLGAMTAM